MQEKKNKENLFEKDLGKQRRILYTPKQMTQILNEIGESYSRKETLLSYGTVLLGAVILGLFFHLRPGCMLTSSMLCMLFMPRLVLNRKWSHFEKKRFDNINSYMTQMVQSFTSNHKILLSLKETLCTFPEGKMNQVLQQAIYHMENSWDVQEAERESLSMIEREYDCEKLRTLHEFLLKAEIRGGSCEAEFRLLEKIREAWERAVLGYRNMVHMARNVVTLEYFILMMICIFMLEQFPEDLCITYIPFVQVINSVQIVCFVFVFERMDRRLTDSLLKDPNVMSKEKADRAFSYISNFQPSVERKKQIPLVIVEAAAMAALFCLKPKASVLGLGIVLFLIILNMHNISFFLTLYQLKEEIAKAFPKWLFDVLLLLQSENVQVALFKSIEKAPPVLVDELERIKSELEAQPDSADAFMSFLARFQIPGVENTMRKLYSLSVGTGGSTEVMEVIIDSNMTMLSEAEKQNIKMRGEMSSISYFLPTIPTIFCMVGYCIALIVVIFQNVMVLI